MGRAMFPGGIMVLVEAHLLEGRSSGKLEYSQVLSRGENTFRLMAQVECVGVFGEGSKAVVAGPITRTDGDFEGRVKPGDWWFVHLEEGGEGGDRISAGRHDRHRALALCQQGPSGSATLEAVEGDLSIH
jgi:hypothetical protein